MTFGMPAAPMGFVGYAQMKFYGGPSYIIRANTMNVRLSQDITAEDDIVAGRFDKNVYMVGPKIVEGDIGFPAVMDRGSGSTDSASHLYKACVERLTSGSNAGRLNPQNWFDIDTKYANGVQPFTYTNCIVNTYNFTAAQQEGVDITVGVMGEDRKPLSVDNNLLNPQSNNSITNARRVTWNDVNVTMGVAGYTVGSEYVRNFDITIDNDAERYFTLNGKLSPQDIAARIRDISGSITIMGRHAGLAENAVTNEQRSRAPDDTYILFGYQLGYAEASATFLAKIPNVVYHVEEIEIRNEVIETTHNWQAYPDVLNLADSDHLDTGS